MKTTSFSFRVKIIFVFIILFALLIIARLYFLEIINGDSFYEKADRQYVSSSNTLFDRGSIYFQNKEGALLSAATLKTGYTIAINPSKILDKENVYKSLSKYISLDPAEYYSKVSKNDDPYEELIKRVPEEVMKQIEEMKLTGVIIEKDKWRYYPGGDMSANVIGFVGYSGDALVGRYGLEKYYEDTLKRGSDNLYINVFAEIFSNLKKTLGNDNNREGDIITTIEPEVQGFVDKTISDVNKKWKSKFTGAIVIDPTTGEIYSMSTVPGFDLNEYSKEKDMWVYSNPSISSAFEIGSVVKAITVASGLDSGSINANTTFIDKGFVELDGRTIYNVDKNGRGVTTMQEVLNHSMNTGVSFIVKKMGNEKFAEYIRKFGIGTETGVDLPNEVPGDVSNLKSPRNVEYATASFGQGISMTPINAVRAFSVIANGGRLITPHIVRKIDYKVGFSKNIYNINESVQVIKKESSEETTRMLVNLVDTALLQGRYKMNNYSVAAKTGTAQIARPASEGGGYYTDKFFHSFFGYFPAYKPRFLIFLYTYDPKGVDFGSQTLTEPFFDITKYLINYYEIPPDRQPLSN